MSSFKAAVRAALVDARQGPGLERAPIVLHTFPIRRDLEIQVEVPRDMTDAEVERVSAFLHSLVIDET